MNIKRVFLIVLDSFGIGEAPDACDYNDQGSNTLVSIYNSPNFNVKSLKNLGLFNIDGVTCESGISNPIAAYGRLRESSKGKDTTTGHWEICGIISEKPMPTFPNGFPQYFIDEFSKKINTGVLCNKVYSGTEVIKDYGEEHIKTGKPIVYTSADSVFQIAAHEDIVPLDELYKFCKIAREMLTGELAVGRVIARPFIGEYPNFTRTSNRHDFSLIPPKDTILNCLQNSGYDVIGIGKIWDIFAGSGINKKILTKGNLDGMSKTLDVFNEDFNGLCFTNLVDFDMLYGHRNDVDNYAKAMSEFDNWLTSFLPMLKDTDMLIITADHGCDPATPSTDHSREYVPVLMYNKHIKPTNLGTRNSFADLGKTIGDIFNITTNIAGTSFIDRI